MLQVHIRSAGYAEGEPIIHNIIFSVVSGELVALIGANGAGKSTIIKAILGLLPHMDGTVSINGGGYAYVPEQPVYYDYLTLWEHMELLAAAKMLDTGWEEDAEELLRIFRMEESKHSYIGQFSKGMKQKVMLMLAFLAKPDFYIVDEPFLGLDPTAIRDFLTLLQKERKRGVGVLLCTHVLDTAERICERFLLVSSGELLANGSLANIQQLAGMPNATLMDCFDVIVRQEQYE
ncbi:ABC transporter ATP-binding protein [Ectobacillus panaciterrae]|uniref:ABC transporter ATP-binding protein n=1 Tax=Ectobacillus panaciterrae TaxID=363872 RepID=UPI000421E28C|nr:ABC transporter ATP-binding protein [Ectobacillus panaciterrae]